MNLEELFTGLGIDLMRSSPESKKNWRTETIRMPNNSKKLLAAMKQATRVPMEDIVNEALLKVFELYVMEGRIAGRPLSTKPRQLEMFDACSAC